MTASRRVAVADDDVLLREGIASLLRAAGYDVVGSTGDPESLTSLVQAERPDLLLIDIRMPPTHTTEGIDAARAIRTEFPEIGILLLSAHVEIETAIDLLESGDRIGYLLKNRIRRTDDLVDALGRIVQGGSVIDPALVNELLSMRHRNDPLAALTPRELEVLALVAEGRSNSGIASALVLSEGAVEKHVHRLMTKLQLPAAEGHHRRVLAVLAYLEAR